MPECINGRWIPLDIKEKMVLFILCMLWFAIWNHDIYSFGYAVLVGVIFSVIFERLIYMKLNRKMNYE